MVVNNNLTYYEYYVDYLLLRQCRLVKTYLLIFSLSLFINNPIKSTLHNLRRVFSFFFSPHEKKKKP